MPIFNQEELQWMLCPICKNKTRIKLQSQTVLQNFLLFCPKCKREMLINVRNFKTDVITEPDANMQNMLKTQSQ